MMRIQANRRLLTLAALAGALAASACGGAVLDARIPKETIQEQVDSRFPMEKRNGPLLVRFVQPRIELDGRRNRVALRVNTEVSTLALWKSKGQSLLDAVLRYEAAEGAFYLQDVQILQIELSGLPSEALDQVRKLAATLLKPSLEKLLLYRLNPGDTKENLARFLLRGIRVEDQAVVATLGLP